MALEFFIKNLCIEIQQECKEEQIECHQNFMTYFLTLLAYDPLWNLFPKMKEIVRLDALRLIKYVVARMHRQSCPSIITLKIQFYFQCNFEPKHEIVEMYESNFRTRLEPLIEDIIEAKPEDEVEFDLLLKQIIYYSTLWRGLGNPTIPEVYKECYHATISFLDNSDLEAFVKFKTEDKMQQLFDIAAITAGVRLFNWTCMKGGQGIEDLPVQLAQNLSQFRSDISRSLQAVMDKLDILTTAIDYCFIIEEKIIYYPDDSIGTEYKQSCELPDGIEYEEIEFFKDMIIVCRQVEGYLRQQLDVVAQMENTYDELGLDFRECLDRFYSLTHLKAGVPTRVIFPLFIDLDRIWEAYQHEITFLKRMHQIHVDLDLYIRDFYVSFAKLEVIIDDREILNDADRLVIVDEEECLIVDTDVFAAEVILPTSEDFKLDELRLELLGFDIWRLVESQGALIPGNPNLGIVAYNNKYYVFSGRASAFMFAKHPKRCVNECLELARKKVELITLLQLQTELAEVQTLKQLVSDTKLAESNVARCDMGMQTEVHPQEAYIDTKYMWNVWDLKRLALKLCDMSHTVTKHTVQKTFFGSATQTYEARDIALQTKCDNYTNTHTPQTYFFGLRGRKDDKQFILNLTKPVDKS